MVKIRFVACVESVDEVKYSDIVAKFSAGKNTHVSSFAKTLALSSPKIFVFLKANPTAIHTNSTKVGFNVIKSISNI